MGENFEEVYQFKITLKGIKPPIWRRIQVPENYSFWDLHVAIQDAMGWTDTHLHNFVIAKPATGRKEQIGIPAEDFDDDKILPGWTKKIAQYFTVKNKNAMYIYDYGDDWHHSITLEKIIPREAGIQYPICTGGARACPPEDCGGTWGYADFLEAIMEPNHESHEEMLEWAGGEFEPEHFDINDIDFDDPQKRLKYTLEQ